MNATYSVILNSGLSIGSGSQVVSADTNNPFEVVIPKAIAGALSTRTDADTGIVTVASGHGITDADTVDIYDATGQLLRKDMDVTATDATTISINAGTGTDLPVATTALKVAKQKTIAPVFFDTSGIQLFGIELKVPGATSQGRANFLDSGPTTVGDKTLTANSGLISHVAAGADNPLTGDAVSIICSNGSSDLDGTLAIISMEDRTP
jgi:hypothetical protein